MPYFFVFMPHFVVWILWPELQIYSQGVWFFIEFKNITHEVRPILIFKISIKYFADFDILQILILKLYFYSKIVLTK